MAPPSVLTHSWTDRLFSFTQPTGLTASRFRARAPTVQWTGSHWLARWSSDLNIRNDGQPWELRAKPVSIEVSPLNVINDGCATRFKDRGLPDAVAILFLIKAVLSIFTPSMREVVTIFDDVQHTMMQVTPWWYALGCLCSLSLLFLLLHYVNRDLLWRQICAFESLVLVGNYLNWYGTLFFTEYCVFNQQYNYERVLTNVIDVCVNMPLVVIAVCFDSVKLAHRAKTVVLAFMITERCFQWFTYRDGHGMFSSHGVCVVPLVNYHLDAAAVQRSNLSTNTTIIIFLLKSMRVYIAGGQFAVIKPRFELKVRRGSSVSVACGAAPVQLEADPLELLGAEDRSLEALPDPRPRGRYHHDDDDSSLDAIPRARAISIPTDGSLQVKLPSSLSLPSAPSFSFCDAAVQTERSQSIESTAETERWSTQSTAEPEMRESAPSPSRRSGPRALLLESDATGEEQPLAGLAADFRLETPREDSASVDLAPFELVFEVPDPDGAVPSPSFVKPSSSASPPDHRSLMGSAMDELRSAMDQVVARETEPASLQVLEPDDVSPTHSLLKPPPSGTPNFTVVPTFEHRSVVSAAEAAFRFAKDQAVALETERTSLQVPDTDEAPSLTSDSSTRSYREHQDLLDARQAELGFVKNQLKVLQAEILAKDQMISELIALAQHPRPERMRLLARTAESVGHDGGVLEEVPKAFAWQPARSVPSRGPASNPSLLDSSLTRIPGSRWPGIDEAW